MRIGIVYLLVAAVLVGCGCARIVAPGAGDRLDDCRQQAPEFVDSVKKFYRAVQDRDWATTYDMRTATFKHDETRAYYLEQMEKDNPRLNSYKVLSVRMFCQPGFLTMGANRKPEGPPTSRGVVAAEIIIEVNQGASYDCARWKKVKGVWLCEEPGLSVLGGSLQSLRVPDWVYANER